MPADDPVTPGSTVPAPRSGLTRGRLRTLQIATCAVIAWSWLRGDSGPVGSPPAGTKPAPQSTTAPTVPTAASPGAPVPTPPASAATAPRARSPTAAAAASIASTAPGVRPRAAPAAPQQATTPMPGAGLVASTIDVIVSRNDTLDRIFRRLRLNLADLASLRGLPGLKAHLDRLRPGEALRLWHRDGALVGLERRLNESETLKVVRDGQALKADVLNQPLESRARTLHGLIDSSLFEAVEAAGGHDATAIAISEIFGWDIDFVLDIQPGDSFTVSYAELYQDGRFVKDGPIQAASFVNAGHEYLAVRYVDPAGRVGYYTPDGRPMHKAFLRAPVEFSRISSRFNSARHHPILNIIRAHKGVDYAAPLGTPVRAAGDGHVRFAGRKGGYGNVLEIDHGRGIETVYGHLAHFARGLRVGQHVAQGTVVAYVGMTGLATGPHLHYEYRVNGAFKNPQTVSLPSAEPIEAALREDFNAKTAPLLLTLEMPVGPALVAR